jgi:hypothetical protein
MKNIIKTTANSHPTTTIKKALDYVEGFFITPTRQPHLFGQVYLFD